MKCPGCKGKLHISAIACPHCGFDFEGYKKKKMRPFKILEAIMKFTVIIIFFSIFGSLIYKGLINSPIKFIPKEEVNHETRKRLSTISDRIREEWEDKEGLKDSEQEEVSGETEGNQES